jgi:PAS domain S-box-containing protein
MRSVNAARGLEIGRSIFREASDAFFVFDPRDDRVIDVNPAAMRLTGFDRPELIAMRVEDLVTAEGDGLARLMDSLRKTQFFHSREGYALARRGGQPIAVNVSVSRIHTRPDPLGLIVARDVSELRRTREGLEQFFRHSPALFAVLGPDGRIRATNPAWEPTLGYDPVRLTGRAFLDLIHTEDRAVVLGAATGRTALQPALFEARFLRADGGWVWLSWSAGTIGGATYAVALDITSRKEAEALRRAKEAAEAASVEKNRLLANVSHELRTPLSAMLGLLDALLDQAGAGGYGAIFTDLEVIRRNAAHLARLINDLLDLSRAEAGRLEIRRAACRVSEVMAEVFELLRPAAAAKALVLTVSQDPSAPEAIWTDPLRLQQILLNLVNNAIKYTESGSVTIRVRSEGPGPAGPRVCFDVIDTGCGLEPEALASLFQPFRHGSTGVHGAGLGLAISRKLAELLGGTITVESRPGLGSTFTLVIDGPPFNGDLAPVAGRHRAGARAPAPRTSAPRLPCRILVAEDHDDNRRALSRRLERAGIEVLAVADGQQAAAAALAATAEQRPFDVILMDMHMPVADGFEATAELRAAGYRGAIIALTADAGLDDRQECLRFGCDEHLGKPVDWDQLLGVIAALVPADGSRAITNP